MAVAEMVGISTGGDPITLDALRKLISDTEGWKPDSAVYVTASKGKAHVLVERRV